MTEKILKIKADSNGVWISAAADNFTQADVTGFLRSKGVRKYDGYALKEFVKKKDKHIPHKIAARCPTEETRPIVVVKLSNDYMTASDTVEPPFFTNPWPDKAEILEFLKQKGVVFGVDEETIKKLTELKLADEPVIVARGKPPINGNNALIELLIDPDQAPKVDLEAEKIDHRVRSAFITIKQGDKIAVKHSATQGEPGMTVAGTVVGAANGKDVSFPITSGFNVSEDGLLLTAAIDGHLLRRDNKLSILPELEVRGDVDYSVGNIDFRGCVKIRGTVRDGFQVLADGDIEVMDIVEGARLESSAGIIISGGVRGMGKGKIIAAGNIIASYVDQVYMYSDGEINIRNSILHSEVAAKQTITVMGGRKAQIIGGKIQAGMAVICHTLGSEMGTKTEVTVGLSPRLVERRKELQNSITKYKQDIEALETNLRFLKKQDIAGLLSKNQRIVLANETKFKFKVQLTLKALEDELQDIEAHWELTKSKGVVKVSDICYPGVVVTVRGATYIVKEPFKHVTFFYEEGEIRLRPFEA